MSMDIYPDFREWFESLNAAGVEYLLIGGHAMAYHGWPRYTKDLDVLVHAEAGNTERFIDALIRFGVPPASIGVDVEEFAEERFFYRLGRPPTQLDIMSSVPGVEWNRAWKNRMEGQYGGVPITVIGRTDLIRNKEAVGRGQDLDDVKKLRAVDDSFD